MAFPGSDEQIDKIPFEGIDMVQCRAKPSASANQTAESTRTAIFSFPSRVISMDGDSDADNYLDPSDPVASNGMHILHITTRHDSYNAGRAYYLSFASAPERDDMHALLEQYAASARLRKEAHSVFRKAQRSIRVRYDSPAFQYLVAALIAAARRPPASRKARRATSRAESGGKLRLRVSPFMPRVHLACGIPCKAPRPRRAHGGAHTARAAARAARREEGEAKEQKWKRMRTREGAGGRAGKPGPLNEGAKEQGS